MTRIEEIEQAIVSLPADEYNRFPIWFLDRDWETWDCQIVADSAAGMRFLAFLLFDMVGTPIVGRHLGGVVGALAAWGAVGGADQRSERSRDAGLR